MNKHSNDPFQTDINTPSGDLPLSRAETAQLREILKVVSYDAPSETLRIAVGDAKILVRGDGQVRIEGKRLVQMAHGSIVLNGAAIELN